MLKNAKDKILNFLKMIALHIEKKTGITLAHQQAKIITDHIIYNKSRVIKGLVRCWLRVWTTPRHTNRNLLLQR